MSSPTPGRSSRACPRLSRGSSTAAPASATTPTGTLTQKIDRQPVPNASAAMSGPPSAWPMTALPDMVITRTLSARARARPSKLTWIPVSTCGTMTAAQAPWAIRAPMSTPAPGARLQASEARVNPARPARYTRRYPAMRPSRAPVMISIANARTYPDTTNSSAPPEACRSRWMDGVATLTIAMSTLAMNWPATSTASSHRWRSRVVMGVSFLRQAGSAGTGGSRNGPPRPGW